jgi:hypothetical protein
MLLLFCFGIGEVEFLYDPACMDRFANAVSNIYAAGGGDAGDDPDVDVVRVVGRELEARNIAVTFIGEEFTWIFDRSTSTFIGRAGAKQPPVPILTAADGANARSKRHGHADRRPRRAACPPAGRPSAAPPAARPRSHTPRRGPPRPARLADRGG